MSVKKNKLAFRAYLDIETSWSRDITVIGIFRPGVGTRQWINPNLHLPEIQEFLAGVEVLLTYNGGAFDLPVIHQQLGVNLKEHHSHRDLMRDCWSKSLYGGLKKVEMRLGIHRDTEGVDGLAAMKLWDRFAQVNDREALDLLLRYNREDVENLEILALKLGVITQEEFSQCQLSF